MIMFYYLNRFIKKLKGAAIKNSVIDKTSKIEAGSQIINVNMGKYSFCGYDCKILDCNIGAFCSIADNVVIGGAQHPITWASTSPVFYEGRDSVRKKFSSFPRNDESITEIGNDVWIGDHVLIKGGVSIGNGAVIGMGSVVTKDVAPYEIVGGAPAKHIKYRFNKQIVDKMQSTKWWDMDDESLEKAAKDIRNPELFLENIVAWK